MTKKNSNDNKSCPITGSINIFGGKWKPEAIYFINQGPKRFNELRRLIPGVSQRMLTQQLRELERDGIISRKQYLEIPPKVVYSMTELGKTLIPIFGKLEQWTTKNIDRIQRSQSNYDKKNS